MDKLPWSELEKRIADAKALIPAGSKWQHYKGGKYVVIDAVIVELTNEVGVIYRSLEHPTTSFLRPLVEWQDVIEWEGQKVYRFRQI